jgi:chloride channel 7
VRCIAFALHRPASRRQVALALLPQDLRQVGPAAGGWQRARARTTPRCTRRWLFNFAIAVFVALTAVAVNYCTNQLARLRMLALDALVSMEKAGSLPFGLAVTGLAAVSLGYVACAAIPTAWIEPVAAGSGISEVKCVLNGVLLPRVTRFKTLVVKVVGICFSVASGLPGA